MPASFRGPVELNAAKCGREPASKKRARQGDQAAHANSSRVRRPLEAVGRTARRPGHKRTFPVSNASRNWQNYPCDRPSRRSRWRVLEQSGRSTEERDILFADCRLARYARGAGDERSGTKERRWRNWPMPSAKRPSSTPLSGRPSPSFWPGGATSAISAREAPDEATLAELFDLAALAPSVGNCQPTRFVRVDDKARRASIRANFEAANRDALGAYGWRAGGALRQAQACGLNRRADPARGLLRRGDRAGPWPWRAHHAGNAPLFGGLRLAHILARRARPRPWRRLGVDPRSRRRSPRRSTFHAPGRSSPIFASAFRARSI